MNLQVLQIRTAGKGFRLAHVKLGDLYGDLPAAEGVEPGKPAKLTNTFKVIDGQLRASLRVERA